MVFSILERTTITTKGLNMKNIIPITKENLQPYYIADPYKGEIISRNTGESIGHVNNMGYVVIDISYKILGKRTTAKRPRMIWTIVNGTITDDDLVIDHINGVKTDDRISNLRLVSQSINSLNNKNKIRKNNKSGHTGVYYSKYFNRWTASIRVNKTNKCKLFKTKTEAIEHRLIMEKEYN